jgi:hypothetical protein
MKGGTPQYPIFLQATPDEYQLCLWILDWLPVLWCAGVNYVTYMGELTNLHLFYDNNSCLASCYNYLLDLLLLKIESYPVYLPFSLST